MTYLTVTRAQTQSEKAEFTRRICHLVHSKISPAFTPLGYERGGYFFEGGGRYMDFEKTIPR